MTFALATAVISSIAAYAALVVATSQTRYGPLLEHRPPSRYAAEAGLVIAQETLWRDPSYVGGAQMLDMDADGTADTTVVISVTPVDPMAPQGRRRIEARVTY